MRITISLLTAAAFSVASVNAIIADLGVPKTIKSGDKFDILGHQTIGQGYREVMIMFGVQDSTYPREYYGPGDMGNIFAGPFDLSLFGTGYNLTIPSVSFYSSTPGPAVIQATVLGVSGVFQRVSLGSFSVNTTIGGSTSKEYVYTNSRGPSCGWQT